jgi:5'-nucleotidase (lipoprotein e(P4) family)
LVHLVDWEVFVAITGFKQFGRTMAVLTGCVLLMGAGAWLGRAMDDGGRVYAGATTQQTAGEGVSLPAEAMLLGVMWTQSSAEARALRLQAYELAKFRLDQALEKAGAGDGRKPAVILDIDETVLDNSPQLASLALTDGAYSQGRWKNWSSKAAAEAIPGAKAFLDYADSRGVAIFYVSNRSTDELGDTVKNLSDVRFPQARESQVLLRVDDSSKEERRQRVAREHQVMLYLGDALGDFDAAFEKKSVGERRQAVDKMAGEFGKRFIVLPNAAYGDWDNAVLDYRRFEPALRVRALRRASLKSFETGDNAMAQAELDRVGKGEPVGKVGELPGFVPGCVVGNVKSKVFHTTESRYYEQARQSKNAVFFKDGEDAEAAGYREARGR